MKRTSNTDKVREDFDRLADISEVGGWDHNVHYHAFLLRQLPERLAKALEVGCGTGAFALSLAERSEEVIAIDLSPRMVEVAKARSEEHPNGEYAVADANSWGFPKASFDCVASITTMHHLPFGPTLAKMRDTLKPGGTLLLLDLYRVQSVADYVAGALGFPASKALKLVKTGTLANRQSSEVRQAWEEHGRGDAYPTLSEVRRACAEIPSGAAITRHLLWRYSVLWRKPIPQGLHRAL